MLLTLLFVRSYAHIVVQLTVNNNNNKTEFQPTLKRAVYDLPLEAVQLSSRFDGGQGLQGRQNPFLQEHLHQSSLGPL